MRKKTKVSVPGNPRTVDIQVKRGALKAFREHLNRTCAGSLHRHYRFGQTKRPYGDYLYAQDREKFDYEFGMAMQGLSAGFDPTQWVHPRSPVKRCRRIR